MTATRRLAGRIARKALRTIGASAPAVAPTPTPTPETKAPELGPEVDPRYADAAWDDSVVDPDAPPMPHTKVLDLADFRHPDLVRRLRDVYAHELRRFGPRWPEGFEDRKQWEVAMICRTLSDLGALRPDAELLGVGVGNDPTSFWLTNHVRRVFATDLYAPHGGTHWAEADASMLDAPGTNWPFAWRPRRLVTQHMDGRDLRYEDESFDGVYSAGSIEHFGADDRPRRPVPEEARAFGLRHQIRRAAAEMCRVLRPGGVLALTTEFRLEGEGDGLPGTMLFAPEMIRDLIVGDLPWDVVGPAGLATSDATRRATVSQRAAVEYFDAHVRREGRFLFHRYRQLQYPIATMEYEGHVWTSVSLALRKR